MLTYANVAKYNLKFNYLPHILLALALTAFTPVLFSITALDAEMVAYPLELSLPFLGVILLTPIYSFEKDGGTLDTIRVRSMPYLFICVMRIVMGMVILAVLTGGFVWVMGVLESQVSVAHVLATYANGIFLGGLGIIAASISENQIIGYMIPVLYFVMDLMGGLKDFTMFSLLRKGTMEGKWILFTIGMICIVISVVVQKIRFLRE